MAQPLIFVEVKHPRLGRWFLEIDRNQNGRELAIEAACDSRQELIKVIEVFEDERVVNDITDEIREAASLRQLQAAE